MSYITGADAARILGVAPNTICEIMKKHPEEFKDRERIGVNAIPFLNTNKHLPILKKYIGRSKAGAMIMPSAKPVKASPQPTKPKITSAAQINFKRATAEELEAVEDGVVDAREPGRGDEEVLTYADARTKREYFTAKQAKLDYERRSGKLVPLDAIESVWKTIALSTQKALLTVPDRIAPLCVGEPDQAVIHKRIADEIRYALKNLAFELKGITTEVMTTQVGDGEERTVVLKRERGRPKNEDK